MVEKENLKGKVESVCLVTGSDSDKTFFDEAGRIIRVEYRHSGNPAHIHTHYVYDKNDRLLSYSGYREDEPDKLIAVLTYEYNKRGLVESFGPYGRGTNYKYDSRGNCILETSYLEKRKIYNRKNQLIEERHYHWDETIHSWGTDKNGAYFEKDEIIDAHEGEHIYYSYNAHGDASYISTKYPNNPQLYLTTITYVYDEHGNWIERNKKDNLGNKVKSTRTIVYYE
jgi:YD repeat-containing protein